jgi:hypothetical protein
LGDGTLYVIDRRTPTPQSAVLEEDIFGEFEVKDGRIVPGSYRPNSKHFLFSSKGFFQLGAHLEDCLLEVLAAILQLDDELEAAMEVSSTSPCEN